MIVIAVAVFGVVVMIRIVVRGAWCVTVFVMAVVIFVPVMMVVLIMIVIATVTVMMIVVMVMREMHIELDACNPLPLVLGNVQMKAVEF